MMKNKAKNTLPTPLPATTGRKKVPKVENISVAGPEMGGGFYQPAPAFNIGGNSPSHAAIHGV
jgi:hypothetical protein